MSTETPENDAAAMDLHGKRLATGGWWVEADFARKLERERNALKNAIAKHRDQFPDEALDGDVELWSHIENPPTP